MNSRENGKAICPESTLESANRRNFIRKATLATAAVGVGSTLLAKNVIPKSFARTDCQTLVCNCLPCEAAILGTETGSGGIGVEGCATGTHGAGIRGCSSGACGVGVGGHATGSGQTIGVNGVSTSTAGHGVNGTATAAGGVGVRGLACNDCAIPIVARGTGCQKANLQQWQRGCTHKAVVNKCGWFGIGTCTPSTPLDVVGTIKASSSVCVGIAVCGSSSGSGGVGVVGTASGATGCGVRGTATGACGYGVFGRATGACGIGVFGCSPSAGGKGVFGRATTGHAVCGTASFAGGVGIRGVACNDCAVPIVARGTGCQKANLQQWQRGCTHKAVVNKCGWFGIGTCTPSTPLDVVGTIKASCSVCVGIAVCGSSSGACGCGVRGTETATYGYGVSGKATGACGIGVFGCASGTGKSYGVSGLSSSTSGAGVRGGASAKGGIGVEGYASSPCSVPMVAKGAKCQVANLQQWENSCGTVFAVINKAGSLGLGGVTSPHHVLCISGKAHASSGFSIGPCTCINTTLAVNGSFAAKTRTVGSTSTIQTTDYAILATGTITLTLPPAKTQNGMTIFIKNTSTSTVSVVPGGTDSIEGSSTARTLTKQYDSLTLLSNGSNEWFIQSGAKCGVYFT